MFALDSQYLQVEVGNVRDVDWIVKTPGQTSAGAKVRVRLAVRKLGTHIHCVCGGGGGVKSVITGQHNDVNWVKV